VKFKTSQGKQYHKLFGAIMVGSFRKEMKVKGKATQANGMEYLKDMKWERIS
jgi:hypothetical protein